MTIDQETADPVDASASGTKRSIDDSKLSTEQPKQETAEIQEEQQEQPVDKKPKLDTESQNESNDDASAEPAASEKPTTEEPEKATKSEVNADQDAEDDLEEEAYKVEEPAEDEQEEQDEEEDTENKEAEEVETAADAGEDGEDVEGVADAEFDIRKNILAKESEENSKAPEPATELPPVAAAVLDD